VDHDPASSAQRREPSHQSGCGIIGRLWASQTTNVNNDTIADMTRMAAQADAIAPVTT